ncbi:MAG: FAD-binding protein [Polyangiaceae bacterium]|nr:FAD-binding protein [Polyangiaceae bacterium]
MARQKQTSRRDFLKDVGLAATTVAASAALAGCSGDEKCQCDTGGSPATGGGNSCPPTSDTGGNQPGNTGGSGPASGGSGGTGGSSNPQQTGGTSQTGGSGGTGGTSNPPLTGGSSSSGGTSNPQATGGDAGCPPPTECPTECPPTQECPTCADLPSEWDQEADVVVLGTGFAGLAAAIAATDAGAEVLILEKMAKAQEGGNSIISGNMWWTPTSATEGATYIKALCAGLTDDPYIQMLAQQMSQLNDWLSTLGITASALGIFQPEYPELPGSGSVRTWSNRGTGGLWQPLKDAVTQRNVTILYETPAVDLILDPSTREVKGAIATSGGKSINVKAKRGVILACGGFEFDYALQAQYLPAWPVYCQGTPGNTGDGIKMAVKAGAALWHMNNALAHVGCFVPDPTDPKSIPISLSLPNNCILVDKFGARFMNEKREERHGFGHKEYLFFFDGLEQVFSRIPCYGILDATGIATKLAGGLMGWYGKAGSSNWSANNSTEITNGWIKQGQTLAALGTAIGVDGNALNATVTRYNELCTAGTDADFGRSASTLKALTAAPYYAIPIYPLMYNTQGGPRRNEKCQVIDPFGTPIPRLYSAGELGSGWGWMYNGGGDAAECVVTGRLSGTNSAGEGPWS